MSFALRVVGIKNAAPKARNIKARGKREARRPWVHQSSFVPAL